MKKNSIFSAAIILLLPTSPSFALDLGASVSLDRDSGISVNANVGKTSASANVGGNNDSGSGGNAPSVSANVSTGGGSGGSSGGLGVDVGIGNSGDDVADAGGGSTGGGNSNGGGSGGGTDMNVDGGGNILASGGVRSMELPVIANQNGSLQLIGTSVWTNDRVLVGVVTRSSDVDGRRVMIQVEMVDSFPIQHDVVHFNVVPTSAQEGKMLLNLSSAQLAQQLS
ncbi:hypothetical protein ACJ5NV_10170 [Loktanella agnita]|uniref:hypothetical protein n=1 Tax=Loktanella agnita TaxID=287097 RepID=UPI00398818EF